MRRFEEDPVVPAFGAPPGAAGPEYLQHRRPILLGHPRQHGRLLPNRPAKGHRATNGGIHPPHTQPNPPTLPRTSESATRRNNTKVSLVGCCPKPTVGSTLHVSAPGTG